MNGRIGDQQHKGNNMTDRNDALIELLAMVQLGNWDTRLAINALPKSHIDGKHKWVDPIGWASRAILHGSLDAANALHLEVLNGMFWVTMVGGIVTILHRGEEYTGVSHDPACAWLIAILKALVDETQPMISTNNKGKNT
jgi:hypothetical protein